MDNKYIFESDIASENEWHNRCGKMENNFSESGLKITKTTFDPYTPNGLLPRDAYYGIHCGPIWEFDEDKAMCTSILCADKLAQLIKPLPRRKDGFSVLVVGIGNRYATPDTLGPLCSDKIITRCDKDGFLPKISVIAPGVYAQTGIDTSDYVRAIAKEICADIIIAVDSLSSKSSLRLGSFIQIGNCGITPGAGIAKRGIGINFSTMGIPVVSIGIPTVISAATLIEAPDKSKTDYTVDDILSRLSVTPKECNAVTEIGASVISRAINACLSTPSTF